jgi:hypothetical protein
MPDGPFERAPTVSSKLIEDVRPDASERPPRPICHSVTTTTADPATKPLDVTRPASKHDSTDPEGGGSFRPRRMTMTAPRLTSPKTELLVPRTDSTKETSARAEDGRTTPRAPPPPPPQPQTPTTRTFSRTATASDIHHPRPICPPSNKNSPSATKKKKKKKSQNGSDQLRQLRLQHARRHNAQCPDQHAR